MRPELSSILFVYAIYDFKLALCIKLSIEIRAIFASVCTSVQLTVTSKG